MTRADLLALVERAPIDPAQKALATFALNTAPDSVIAEVGEVAANGLAILETGDVEKFSTYARSVAGKSGVPAPMIDALLKNVSALQNLAK